MKNPYINYIDLSNHSEMFFNRERDIDQIISCLHNSPVQSVSIYGERKIGKTSLAIKVLNLTKNFKNTISIFLDCLELQESCDSQDKFFQELNRKYSAEVKSEHKEIEALKSNDNTFFKDYLSAKSFIEKQGRIGFKIFIFIDNIDLLYENKFANDDFFNSLKSLSHKSENNISFIVISGASLKELNNKHNKSNTFWSILNPLPIGLFDGNSINKLRYFGFNKYNQILKNEEIDIIEKYAGNFPFFNQIVCKHLFESKKDNTKLDIEKLVNEVFSFYQDMWNRKTEEEQKLLKNLKRKKDRKELSLKELELLGNMQLSGLLKRYKDFYLPFSELFYDFINEQPIKRKKITFDNIIGGLKKIGEGMEVIIGIKKHLESIASDKGQK